MPAKAPVVPNSLDVTPNLTIHIKCSSRVTTYAARGVRKYPRRVIDQIQLWFAAVIRAVRRVA